MRKRRTFAALTIRFLLLVALLGATGFVALICNYGARQEYAEYRLKNIATAYLSSHGEVDRDDLATIMGIAHKESRFWNGAVGRHHEVGVMQISEAIARENALVIATDTKKSTPIQKLLFLAPEESLIEKDQRFDERTSMRIAIDHFLRIKQNFQTRYRLDESAARDLAILAFHHGESRTSALLERNASRNLDALLDSLADPALPHDTWFERAVSVSFSEHVLRYRSEYLRQMPAVLSKDGPDAAGLIANIAATPKEFYTRIFGDMPELERTMREQRKTDQHR